MQRSGGVIILPLGTQQEDQDRNQTIIAKRRAILEAYLSKSSLKDSHQQQRLEKSKSARQILPCSPIKRPPELKYNHSKGCVLGERHPIMKITVRFSHMCVALEQYIITFNYI